MRLVQYAVVFFVLSLVGGAVFFVGGVVRAQEAVELTSQQSQQISTNCVAIKNTLEQLHASDALLRVNRGQAYESLATNFMETFNSRLSSNRLDNGAMATVTSLYRANLTNFRTNYIAYEQKLSEALKIDCTQDPQEFHNTVVEARELRSKVHADIQKLNRNIDDYHVSVGDFLRNYQRVSE